jgi:hypothetical protein
MWSLGLMTTITLSGSSKSFHGHPSTMAIYSISQLTVPEAPFKRMAGAFEFFEDDEHLREWVEAHT